jgi:hypothetical protein
VKLLTLEPVVSHQHFGEHLLRDVGTYFYAANAPLPEQILQAKTVYIDNQSGFATLGDRAYDELHES